MRKKIKSTLIRFHGLQLRLANTHTQIFSYSTLGLFISWISICCLGLGFYFIFSDFILFSCCLIFLFHCFFSFHFFCCCCCCRSYLSDLCIHGIKKIRSRSFTAKERDNKSARGSKTATNFYLPYLNAIATLIFPPFC